MSESYSLPTEPEGIVASLLERFNSGKVSAMMTLYAPGAVFIAKDGRTITDHTQIAAELERDLSLGLPLEAKARHVFVNGDIAQIVVDWYYVASNEFDLAFFSRVEIGSAFKVGH